MEYALLTHPICQDIIFPHAFLETTHNKNHINKEQQQ